MPKPSVLVVDDEPDLCGLLSITFRRMDLDPSFRALRYRIKKLGIE